MSFYRLIFYHAMLGGWAALVGWFVSELLLLRRSGDLGTLSILATAAIVGSAIGGGIALLGALANGRFRGYGLRVAFCLLGGFVGGALGGLIGNLIYTVLPLLLVRALGWMIMGLGIGGVEGLFDRSPRKIRNGLIGGAVGGLLGGLCFDPVARLVGGNMSGRAIAFVILGVCVGLFIGLAQIILREAWLSVEQGFRPGRQFVLNVPTTILGTSEKAQLPFIAFGAKGVEPIHLKIVRREDGAFVLRDGGSRTGTFINGKRVEEEVLRNDDLIQLGPNQVRFRETVRHVASEREAARKMSPGRSGPPPLPEATPIFAAPTSAPKASASPITPGPPPRPQVAVRPVGVQPQAKPAAPPGPRGKPCPRCAKPATPIPGTGQHLCMSCDLKF
jgi:MFS family permease